MPIVDVVLPGIVVSGFPVRMRHRLDDKGRGHLRDISDRGNFRAVAKVGHCDG